MPGASDSAWSEILAGLEAFRDLDPEVVERVAGRLRRRSFAPGELMIRQGEAGDSLMILLEGQARGFLTDSSAERRELATFGPGAIVGEMALVTREPRTADIMALEEVESLLLDRGDFEDLAFEYPELGLVLTSIMAARLGEEALDGMGGKEVGGYVIRRGIGRGAMSVVYEAQELETRRQVALKMMSYRLLYEQGAMARFRREAAIAGQLEHENIARIHRMFNAYRTCFLAMELCEGPELGDWIRSRGRAPEAEVRAIVGQLARSLGYIHAQGVVHRDLKPSNVLFTRSGLVKLADFGLAHAPYAVGEKPLTETQRVLGTPLYMAPELAFGGVADQAADFYSFGCIAYEMLTGELPATGRSFGELFQAKQKLKLARREELGVPVSEELYALLTTSLDPQPERRRLDLVALAAWAAPVGAEPARDQ